MMRTVRTEPAADDVVATVGEAELVVGIPSYNNAKTIGHVAATAVHGLASHFPGRSALVVNSDGGSPDETPEAMTHAAVSARASVAASDRIRIETMRYRGPSGKGSAFRDIFDVAHRVRAKAVVVLDADLRSVAPDWIDRLAGPIISGDFDFVAPLYQRHKFDGTITNSIIYPMTDALFGGGVRQPIGGDFGVGAGPLKTYLDDAVWDTDVARFGVDIWMTTTALARGYRVAQAHLGAKVHDPKDPGQSLAKMLVEVVGTWFGLVERYSEIWLGHMARAEPAPRLGVPPPTHVDGIHIDVQRLFDQLQFGVESLRAIYAEVLPDSLLERLKAISGAAGAIPFGDTTWVKTVYAFALAFRRRVLPRDQLLSSLTPLYLGRVGSFVIANRDTTESEAEEQIERLARLFRSLAPEFAAEWRAERSRT